MAGTRNAASFSDDEDATQLSGAKASRGRKATATALGSSYDASETGKASTRGRGRGRGRGKGATTMKQTTLDSSLGFRRSQRCAISCLLLYHIFCLSPLPFLRIFA